MGSRPYESPPSEWAGARPVGGDVYWRTDPDEPDGSIAAIITWHWCAKYGRWSAAHVGDHTLVSLDPLHLEPSLLWPCCGKHGFVRDGQWTGV